MAKLASRVVRSRVLAALWAMSPGASVSTGDLARAVERDPREVARACAELHEERSLLHEGAGRLSRYSLSPGAPRVSQGAETTLPGSRAPLQEKESLGPNVVNEQRGSSSGPSAPREQASALPGSDGGASSWGSIVSRLVALLEEALALAASFFGPGPRVFPENAKEALCRTTIPPEPTSAPRPPKPSSLSGGDSTKPARLSPPTSPSSSLSGNGARPAPAPSESPSRSSGATSSPGEIQEAAEEELLIHERKKGSKVELPIPWLKPKIAELQRDRPRVLEALSRRRVRLAEVDYARGAPARALAAKADEEALVQKRREDAAVELAQHRAALQKRTETLAGFRGLPAETKADIEERASDELREKGLRPTARASWEPAFWDVVCRIYSMEHARSAVARPVQDLVTR